MPTNEEDQELIASMQQVQIKPRMPTAAMFISLAMLEKLELDVEDIESGDITSTDLLESCLIPEAARITGVWKGTMRNPALPVPDQITLIGAQSKQMCASTEVDDAMLRHRGNVREKDFDQLCAEMEDTTEDEVSLADVVGKLSPNLLVAFGMENVETDRNPKAAPTADGAPRSVAVTSTAAPAVAKSPFSAITNATIVSLPATLIDMDGKNARPFILIDIKGSSKPDESKFVGLELTELQSKQLEISTLGPLEVRCARARALAVGKRAWPACHR